MNQLLDRVLEGLVLPSFSRVGYALRRSSFDPHALDHDLQGKCYVVTGASSGIGLGCAQALLQRGARVVLVGRNAAKLKAAKATLDHSATRGETIPLCHDLSDLDDVRALAQALAAIGPLAAVIHNAGLLTHARVLTRQGHEQTFATHVLAPYLLTTLLQKQLPPGARVIWVSSGGMYTQQFNLARCQALTGDYDGVGAYAQQKRAQVLLSTHFARALAPASVTSNAMHPGWVKTPGLDAGLPGFAKWLSPLLRTTEQGADTVVYLAIADAVANISGQFFLDRHVRPTDRRTHHTAQDVADLVEHCAGVVGPHV